MKLNFSLHLNSAEDKSVLGSFAVEKPLLWDTSISFDQASEDAFEVLMTDSAEEACCFLQNKRKLSEAIFFGESSAVETFFDGLLNVWPLHEKAEMRRARFQKLLKHFQSEFDAWHYKNLLKSTIDSVPDLVWFKDKIGAHMMVNQEFCNTVHKTKEDIRGRGHYYIWDISEEEYKKGEFVCMESETDTMNAGKTCIFDEPLKTSEGMKQLKTYKTPLYDMFGNIEGTVGVAKDVTDFGNMGLELSILVENIPFPLILCDVNWKTLKMNDCFRKLVGIDKAKIQDFDFHLWLERNMTQVSDDSENLKTNSREHEYVLQIGNKDHHFIVIEQEIIDYFRNVSGYFVILRDVTIARNFEAMILNAANTDALTQLYNRRYFEDFMKNNAKRPMTLLYMDLDNFKEVNDKYGHRRGDEILQNFAKFMQECFPTGIISRMGGDEFTLILEKPISEEKMATACELLNQKVMSLFRSGGLQVSVSVGISKTDGTRSYDEILHEADERMYALKKERHAERE